MWLAPVAVFGSRCVGGAWVCFADAYWLLAREKMSQPHVWWCWFVLVFGLACTVFSTAQTIFNRIHGD